MTTIQEVERQAANTELDKALSAGSPFETNVGPARPPIANSGDVESSGSNPMWSVETIGTLWASGFVNRWHCNFDHRMRTSGDMNGGHCHRVAILYLGLFMPRLNTPESLLGHLNAVITALLHDAPEVISGDIPQPGKQRVPELRVGDKSAEIAYWSERTYDDGGHIGNWSQKTPQIALCDLLDAIMLVKQRAPDLLERADWMGDVELCYAMARKLGVAGTVRRLIAGGMTP